MRISERQKNLLNYIVSEYGKTAEPVGSEFLARVSKMNLSSATLRNEMAELEKGGYICQPHTSAGRMPTARGYRFYIENFLEQRDLTKKEKFILEKTLRESGKTNYDIYKTLAKAIAELAPVAVIFAFSKNDFYYTGISNLFSQPEFRDLEIVASISEVIDSLDEVMGEIFENVGNDIEILLGKDNPFGEVCGTVITSYENKDKKGVISFLGPMRMDYETNYSLMKYSKDLINSL